MTENVGRTKLHEQALLCIYQYLFYQNMDIDGRKSIVEIISDVMEVSFDECDTFFKAIIFETIKNRRAYIKRIEFYLKTGWTFERLSLMEQAILLIGTSEIINNHNEKSVAIDVAVDLAKRYGSEDKSYKLVNAILDKIGANYE